MRMEGVWRVQTPSGYATALVYISITMYNIEKVIGGHKNYD